MAGHARSRTVGATGRPMLIAAAASQFAYEGLVGATGQRHGVFTRCARANTNGNGTVELSELVTRVQIAAPAAAATFRGGELAVITVAERSKRSARFGSRGDAFVVARRLP